MKFPLEDVARALGSGIESDTAITRWSVDTRTLEPGDLFTLRGPNHAAHTHGGEAFGRYPGSIGAGFRRSRCCPTGARRARLREEAAMKFPLEDVARALRSGIESDAAITGWSVDTRTIEPGDLLDKGAAATVVERDVADSGPAIRVPSAPAFDDRGVARLVARGLGCGKRPR